MKTHSFNGKGRKSSESAELLVVQTTAISPCRKTMVGAQFNMRTKVQILIASLPTGMKISVIQDVSKEEKFL